MTLSMTIKKLFILPAITYSTLTLSSD